MLVAAIWKASIKSASKAHFKQHFDATVSRLRDVLGFSIRYVVHLQRMFSLD
jgi:hypothetical protein